jgi:hypothetical protein
MNGRAPSAAGEPAVAFGDVVIIGGGCYGTFYARQLTAARERGKALFDRLLVVDRDPACRFTRELGRAADRELGLSDWDEFFDRYFAEKGARLPTPDRPSACPPDRPPDRPDVIVPSPLMPHLMYHWLLRRAHALWPGRRVQTRPLPQGMGTPYDRAAPDGTRYVSFADWICPTHCIEPALCPVIRAPRTWEMAEALERLTRRLAERRPAAGPVLFVCRHQVFGVGTFSVTEILAGEALLRQAGAGPGEVDVLVGTISSCHGAVNLLQLGPA